MSEQTSVWTALDEADEAYRESAEAKRIAADAYAPDADVAELARMIHSVVFVSDLHGGLLTPYGVGRFLRGAFPSITDEDTAQALGAAAMFRGRTFDAQRAFVPPF